jgi:transposase-like protein
MTYFTFQRRHHMNRKLLIGIVGALLALVVAGGVVLAGPALARQVGSGTQMAAPTAQAGTPQPSATGARRGRPAAQLVRQLIGATAEATGLKAKDVAQALNSGQSLAQIAQAHGKTADDIVKAVRTKLQDRLKQAVANGRLTQARADAALAQFDQAAPKVVSDTSLDQQIRRANVKRRAFVNPLVKATADVTGLQPQEVQQQLRAGQSLAQIAQAHGKTRDDILAKLREQGNQRLQQTLDRAKSLIDQPGLGRKPKAPTATPTTSG